MKINKTLVIVSVIVITVMLIIVIKRRKSETFDENSGSSSIHPSPVSPSPLSPPLKPINPVVPIKPIIVPLTPLNIPLAKLRPSLKHKKRHPRHAVLVNTLTLTSIGKVSSDGKGVYMGYSITSNHPDLHSNKQLFSYVYAGGIGLKMNYNRRYKFEWGSTSISLPDICNAIIPQRITLMGYYNSTHSEILNIPGRVDVNRKIVHFNSGEAEIDPSDFERGIIHPFYVFTQHPSCIGQLCGHRSTHGSDCRPIGGLTFTVTMI